MYLLVTFIKIFFEILGFAIIARVLLSWVGTRAHNRFTMLIHDVTEPILAFVKKILPSTGMLDFSPFIALIGLDLIKNVLLYLLSAR